MLYDGCLIFLILSQITLILAAQLGRITSVYFHATSAFLAGIGTGLALQCHWTVMAYVCAACTATHTWRWWNSGGGGGTRCRPETWTHRSQGRRTAPSRI
ncbi:hypothetical protein ACF1GW_22280 [Streptomyces achromogenes]|uniref:hypothetical protein n=1 Tax=Streptomyces achromogenes TaxID=67255 RepID=UPI0036F8275E